MGCNIAAENQCGDDMRNNLVPMFFPKLEENKDFHYAPISLLSVAAPIVRGGFDCKIIDERVDNNYLELLSEYVRDASCVFLTAYTGYQVTRAYEVAKYIKQNFPDVKLVWGGPHVTHLPEQSIESDFVDIVFWGYAETSIIDLITAINNGDDMSKIDNIYYKDKNNKVISTTKNTNIAPKDFANMPYDLIDIFKYINPATKRFIYISTYGCPGICTFCATKTRRKWVPIEIDKVKSDINYLMSKYEFKECVFFDATLFTVSKRVLELSELMNNYDIKWVANARSQEIFNTSEELLSQLIKNGLIQLTIGLESGSENVVRIMKKGKDHLFKYEEVAKKLSKLNIKLASGLIFGSPGETIDDLKKTIAYVKKIKKINSNFFISSTFFKPLPDTILYDVVRQKGTKMPDTLEEWAKVGASSHYKYNEWMDNPWMIEPDVKEYRLIYGDFLNENKELFT
jgi:anaerobic magnesium-protoporphyrin IX monomethyl ester cyclase